MQLIGEGYHLMQSGLGLSPKEMAQVFACWDQGPLQSCSISITSRILERTDEHGRPTVDVILDTLAPFFTHALHTVQTGWRRSVARAIQRGIPTPALPSGTGGPEDLAA